jgi:RimJ/RimL family protein N-acetyltransferase
VRFVIDERERLADWMFDRHGWLFHEPFTAIGQETDDGRIICVSVFNNYNGIDIEWTSSGRYTRGMWRVTLDYIFGTNSCRRCTMRTRPTNLQTIKTLIHLGARIEGRLRWYYGDEDALVFGLLKEDAIHV